LELNILFLDTTDFFILHKFFSEYATFPYPASGNNTTIIVETYGRAMCVIVINWLMLLII